MNCFDGAYGGRQREIDALGNYQVFIESCQLLGRG